MFFPFALAQIKFDIAWPILIDQLTFLRLVLPLQRIWCLFEVYHTIRLAKSGRFQGLLLCTSTGVLQEGKAGRVWPATFLFAQTLKDS